MKMQLTHGNSDYGLPEAPTQNRKAGRPTNRYRIRFFSTGNLLFLGTTLVGGAFVVGLVTVVSMRLAQVLAAG